MSGLCLSIWSFDFLSGLLSFYLVFCLPIWSFDFLSGLLTFSPCFYCFLSLVFVFPSIVFVFLGTSFSRLRMQTGAPAGQHDHLSLTHSFADKFFSREYIQVSDASRSHNSFKHFPFHPLCLSFSLDPWMFLFVPLSLFLDQ